MNLSKHPLLKQCYDVMQAIEMCGASPALTAAVIKAGELLESIDKQLHPENYKPITTPSMSDQTIEQELQAKGKTAPRITPADIEANIASEFYFTASQGAWAAAYEIGEESKLRPDALELLTFCVLVLRNGAKVVGINYGPVSAANFDADIARRESRAHAIEQVWPLMGYELRSKLARAAEADAMPRPTSDAPIAHIPV